MKPLAFVHNDAAPYRLGLFDLLAEREGAEFLLYQGRSVAGRDVAAQARALHAPHRLLSQREVGQAIGGGDYRAVVCSTNGRVALPAAYRAARRAGIPFVLWASMWRHPRTLAHRLGWPLVRRIYRGADAVVTYGPHITRFVAEVRGSERHVFEAPQATANEAWLTEPSRNAAAAARAAGGERFVLFVGRMEEAKGVGVLAEAWRTLAGDGELEGARLVAVGDGPMAVELRRLPDTVVVPPVPYDELPAWYSAAEATVVPSIPTREFLEPWGFVCNESLLRETPVIASDAVGAVAGGLVTNRETGLVVPHSDVKALSGAIRTLLTNPQLCAELGVRGRERVGAKYTHGDQLRGFATALEAVGAGARR